MKMPENSFPIRVRTAVLYFFIPFPLLLEFEFIGRLIGLELILAVLVVPAFLMKNRDLTKEAKLIFFWIFLWLGASLISDFFNSSDFSDAARGWARLIFLASNFFVLYKFLDSEDKWLIFLLGTLVAWLVRNYFESIEIQTFWKFGGGLFSSIVSIVVIMLIRKEHWKASLGVYIAIFAFCAFLSLALNSRSSAAGFLVASLLLFLLRNKSLAERIHNYLGRNVVLSLFALASVFYFFGYLYVISAESGMIGEEAQMKIEAQRLGGFDPVLGLVFGGRPEVFASSAAIIDRPLIGHGSWAKGREYVNVYLSSLIYFKDKSDFPLLDEETGLIPTHSHIFGAWVDSGIVGAGFWIFVMTLIRKRLALAVFFERKSDLIFISLLFWLIWDVFFSPFGALMRLWWAIIFVYISRDGFESKKEVMG